MIAIDNSIPIKGSRLIIESFSPKFMLPAYAGEAISNSVIKYLLNKRLYNILFVFKFLYFLCIKFKAC